MLGGHRIREGTKEYTIIQTMRETWKHQGKYPYQKNKGHHTLKGVVCYSPLFLGCSRIENCKFSYYHILKNVVFNS